MLSPHNPHQNHLLDALPADDYERLSPHLELVEMTVGHALQEPGRKLHYGYFPITSIVSRQYLMEDGASTEIAMIGNEGMVGACLFMGGDTTNSLAIVQSAGHAYRLPAQVLKREFNRPGELQHLLLRYTQALLSQIALSAVCNRHHSLDQQLCRCLLMRLDRLSSNELVMTQEQIANMLGVRRESVTEAACRLQNAGLIEYHRGHITVLDRAGLETRVCECYAVIKLESVRLLPERHRSAVRAPVAGTRACADALEAAKKFLHQMSSDSAMAFTPAPRLDSRHRKVRKEDRAYETES